jgi:hypothetical protein
MKAFIPLALLLFIACGASGSQGDAGAQRPSSSSQSVAFSEPWWTEQDAIAVVQHDFGENLVEVCGAEHSHTEFGVQDCNLIPRAVGGRPELYALRGYSSGAARRFVVQLMFEEGQWAATYEPDEHQWLGMAAENIEVGVP